MNGNPKIFLSTLGCAKNVVDSERLLRQLEANRFTMTNKTDEADIFIINTCGFIEPAKEESINAILEAAEKKKNGKGKKIYVTGCLSQRYAEELKAEIPEIDVLTGIEAYEDILAHLGGTLKTELLGERSLLNLPHTAYLKISEGCDHSCSFCAIPLIKGKHRSVPIEKLVKEAEFLASKGTKELVVIAQDTTNYGYDLYGKRNLAELLEQVSRVNGIEWIRVMYTYPTRFPLDVADVMAENEKILPYLDIPLQHISDNVLKSMRRGITSGKTLHFLTELRNRIPGLVLRTTFIVGYPSESEEDYEKLLRFVEEQRFDRLGVFSYSPEENTSAFGLGDPIDHAVKLDRADRLMQLQSGISAQLNELLVGKTLKVIIDGIEGDYYIGRSYRDAPEVDGEVLIETASANLSPGMFVDAAVTDSDEYDLFATVNES